MIQNKIFRLEEIAFVNLQYNIGHGRMKTQIIMDYAIIVDTLLLVVRDFMRIINNKLWLGCLMIIRLRSTIC